MGTRETSVAALTSELDTREVANAELHRTIDDLQQSSDATDVESGSLQSRLEDLESSSTIEQRSAQEQLFAQREQHHTAITTKMSDSVWKQARTSSARKPSQPMPNN